MNAPTASPAASFGSQAAFCSSEPASRIASAASTVPSKLQNMASPIESNVPSLPHRQTLAVMAMFWKALAWLVICQAWRIGAV